MNYTVTSNSDEINENFKNRIAVLESKMRDFNLNKVGKFKCVDIVVEAFHENNFAGCGIGSVRCKALYIDIIFIEEKFRDKKFGTNILQKLEEKSLEFDAQYFYLNTANFQMGKSLYEKNGYKVVYERDIWTEDHTKYIDYLMVKHLK
jgi:hypothetical protein